MKSKFWMLGWCPVTKNGFYDSRYPLSFKARKPSKRETPPGQHWIRVRIEEVYTP